MLLLPTPQPTLHPPPRVAEPVIARFLAAGLGAGFSPRAPGTAGSLAALLPGVAMMFGPSWLLPVACVLVSLGGIAVIARVDAADDPGWVVIDEVAGQWIALLGLAAPTWQGVLAAFALFRLFDITKWGPIGWADRQHAAWGIMADDVLAGIAAAVVLVAARYALHLAA